MRCPEHDTPGEWKKKHYWDRIDDLNGSPSWARFFWLQSRLLFFRRKYHAG